jgi:hypothetical protein
MISDHIHQNNTRCEQGLTTKTEMKIADYYAYKEVSP